MTNPDWYEKELQQAWAEHDEDVKRAAPGRAEEMNELASQLRARALIDRIFKATRTAFRAEWNRCQRQIKDERWAEQGMPYSPDAFRSLACLALYQVFGEHASELPDDFSEAVSDMFIKCTYRYKAEPPCFAPPIFMDPYPEEKNDGDA